MLHGIIIHVNGVLVKMLNAVSFHPIHLDQGIEVISNRNGVIWHFLANFITSECMMGVRDQDTKNLEFSYATYSALKFTHLSFSRYELIITHHMTLTTESLAKKKDSCNAQYAV